MKDGKYADSQAQQNLWVIIKTVSNDTFETVFMCG